MVSIGQNGEMSRTIFDASGNDTSIQGLNTLNTSWSIDGFIIDIPLIPMDGGSLIEPGILMYSANDRILLGLNLCQSSNEYLLYVQF
jgi:hypothetical protein